jgi:putative heme-binding domain-containing protein
MGVFRVCALLLVCAPLFAQHAYTTGDVEGGGRLFRANCTVCHGPDGDFVPGVDFSRGKFRHATDDDDIVEIILKGIPGTGMPSHNFTEMQAETIVAYLRSLPTAGRSTLPGGNSARGKAIVEGKGGCLSCHRVLGNGSRVGPDLSDIGIQRRIVELEQALVDPDAEILPDNRFVKVVTKDGTEIIGPLLNIDTLTLQMMDSQEHLRFFQKADLREYSLVKKSPMPSYKGKLTTQELADLVTYLVSLKGI